MHTQTKLGAKSVPRFARNIFRSRNDNTFNIVLVGVVAPFGKLEVSFTVCPPKNLTSYSPDHPSKDNAGREIGSALPKNKFPTAPRQHPQHCFGGWDVGAAPFGKPEVSFGARCSQLSWRGGEGGFVPGSSMSTELSDIEKFIATRDDPNLTAALDRRCRALEFAVRYGRAEAASVLADATEA